MSDLTLYTTISASAERTACRQIADGAKTLVYTDEVSDDYRQGYLNACEDIARRIAYRTTAIKRELASAQAAIPDLRLVPKSRRRSA